MSELTINVEIDLTSDAAYISLGSRPVARTVQFDEMTMVDLDEHEVVVGIELLSLGRPWALDGVIESSGGPLSPRPRAMPPARSPW